MLNPDERSRTKHRALTARAAGLALLLLLLLHPHTGWPIAAAPATSTHVSFAETSADGGNMSPGVRSMHSCANGVIFKNDTHEAGGHKQLEDKAMDAKRSLQRNRELHKRTV